MGGGEDRLTEAFMGGKKGEAFSLTTSRRKYGCFAIVLVGHAADLASHVAKRFPVAIKGLCGSLLGSEHGSSGTTSHFHSSTLSYKFRLVFTYFPSSL